MCTRFDRVVTLCGMAVLTLSGTGGSFAGPLVGPGLDAFDRELGSASQGGRLLNYEFFRPPGHGAVGELPLVVFLHGYTDGQSSKQSRLNDTMRDLVHATQKENDQRPSAACTGRSCPAVDDQLAAYLLVPKIPIVAGWSSYLDIVQDIMEDVGQRYSVDARRTYLAGYSDGGFATVEMLERYPALFAAGVPISGGGFPSPSTLDALQEVPLWFFHGSNDGTVDPTFSTGLYEALVAAGNTDVHLNLVPGGHNAGYEFAFRDAANVFYPWLFSRTLSATVPEPSTASLALLAVPAILATKRRTSGHTSPAHSL